MATSTSSLPLPEITTDDFERSWTRFHLVAAASKWDDEKKLLMLPALLRGKLVEIFISLSAEEKETLTKLKQALSDRAGITRDSLTSAKAFSERKQGAYESVRDYEIDLTRLFKEAYPNEDTTKSAVLLQGFLGGFRPEITRHILLKGTPNKPEDALKEALAVERALAFQGSEKHETPVQVVRTKTTPPAAEKCEDPRELQKLMSEMLIRLQSLESGLAERRKTDEAQRRDRRRCFTCHKLGHISRNCPTSEPRNSERPRRQGPYRGDSEEEDPVKNELQTSNCCLGYRAMWRLLQLKYRYTIKRSTVMMLLAVMDPIASRLRKVKRLTRRTYLNMASDQPHVCSYLYLELSVSFQGPNWCWHIDGYDKLKPFGFPIHVCIDGFSRKIIWLELTATNNDPDVVVKFY
eukprot:Em0023g691a